MANCGDTWQMPWQWRSAVKGRDVWPWVTDAARRVAGSGRKRPGAAAYSLCGSTRRTAVTGIMFHRPYWMRWPVVGAWMTRPLPTYIATCSPPR